MYNDETVKSIREKCLELLLKWEVLEKSEDENLIIVSNPESKVTLSAEIDRDENQIYGTIYKITDQASLIRPLKARLIWRNEKDFHFEWSGFKDDSDILNALNR